MGEMKCPDNEFTEHATADMRSMDAALHYILNPEKSDFPEAAERQREWWEEKWRKQNEHRV